MTNEEEQLKEVLFISVTDEENSNNRKYSDSILYFCDEAIRENRNDGTKYEVIRHDTIASGTDLKVGLLKKIDVTSHYIILLDQYEDGFNPNVWFELGLVSTMSEAKLTFIAKHNTTIPFEIGTNANVVHISEDVLNILKEKFNSSTFAVGSAFNSSDIYIRELKNKIRSAFDNSNNPFTSLYEQSLLKQQYGFDSFYKFLEGIRIKELLDTKNGSVRYIDGEKEAFEQLTEAVEQAQHSLRTSRFANQSIVKRNANTVSFHNDFMRALQEASYRIDGNFDRIICINSAEKWYDVHTALCNFCPENTKVYLRKSEYSIKFELVIIDEEVSFIHFYLADNVADMKDRPETIRSTLKITGSKISKKLAHIFDRLHHRDYNEVEPVDLSRTLLGVEEDKEKGELLEASKSHGYLSLSHRSSAYNTALSEDMRNNKKYADALAQIKKVQDWKLEGVDKQYIDEFLGEFDK